MTPTLTELPPAILPQQADTPPADTEPAVRLGDVACSGGALALQILFAQPAMEAGQWLTSRIGQAQADWKTGSEVYRQLTAARESVTASETELATVTQQSDTAKRDWELALESGGDFSASETTYSALQGRARTVEQRLTVQRNIAQRRYDEAIQAWRAEFTSVLRAERERLEADVAGLRRIICRHLPGDALRELRQLLTVGVPLAMGQVDPLTRCI